MENNSKGMLPNWLRYILAIPAGIALVLVACVVQRLMMAIYYDPNALYTILVKFFFSNFTIPALFIYGVYLMLPKHKVVIPCILCGIIMVFAGLALLHQILQSAPWQAPVGSALTFISALMCFILVLVSGIKAAETA